MTDVSKIKEHMDVIDSAGKKVGQVDHLEGNDKIKLTKSRSPDGKHHFVRSHGSIMSTPTFTSTSRSTM